DESTITRPGRRAPERSPSVTSDSAVRSLTEPPGLNHSHLPHTSAPAGRPARRRRKSGVCPIASRIDSRTGTAAAARVTAPPGSRGGRGLARLEVAGPREVGHLADGRAVAADG